MNLDQMVEWLNYLIEDEEPHLTARDFEVLAAIRDALKPPVAVIHAPADLSPEEREAFRAAWTAARTNHADGSTT